MEGIHELLKFLLKGDRRSKILLVTHGNADVDACTSVYVFQEFLKKLGFNFVKSYISSFSTEAKTLVEKYGLSFNFPSPEYQPDIVFLLDLNVPERAPAEIREKILRARKIFVIDHHVSPKSTKLSGICKKSSSTSEIIIELVCALGYEEFLKEKKIAKVLAAGILADTVMLKHASKNTFTNYSLVADSIDHQELQKIFIRKKDFSERLAILKAFSRSSVLRLDNIIIAVSQVGSFESSVAVSLLRSGADIAVVIAPKREKGRKFYRVVLRTKLDINLAQIANKIAMEFSGVGGGHEKVAALEVPHEVDIEFVLRKIFSLISAEIQNKKLSQQ